MRNEKEIKKFCNYLGYSDVTPFEVVEVRTENKVMVREMDCEALPWKRDFHPGGFHGHTSNQHDQKWKITSNEKNPVFAVRFSKRKNIWRSAGGSRFAMSDEAIKFYDFNF